MRATGRASVLGSLCLLVSVAGIGVAHAAAGHLAQAQPTATTVITMLYDGTNSGPFLTEPAGTAVTDTATLSGDNAGTATGTVTYTVYSDPECSMPVPSSSSTVTVTGSAVPASAPQTLPGGTYYWQAAYSGDANNAPSVSTCGSEVETVTPTPTTVTTSLSDGINSGASLTEPVGAAVTDTATLSGANASAATGSVTYTVYSDPNCTIAVNGDQQTEQITTPGALPASAPVTLTVPGTYYWQAWYSGDSENEGSASTCGPGGEVETVLSPTSVSTTLAGGGQSGPTILVQAGTTVIDQATLSGATAASASGTVTYDVYSDAACTDLVNRGTPEAITAGMAPPSAAVTLTTAGTYYWQASYSGDGTNAPSQTSCGDEVETVTPAQTTVTTSLSGDGQFGTTISVPAGTGVSDTATLYGINSANATGTVTYTVYSDSTCTTEVSTEAQPVTAGIAVPSDPVIETAAGTYYWQASYSGDQNDVAYTTPCGSSGEVETVTKASTTASASLSGDGQLGSAIIVPAGTAVSGTATLSGTDAVRATGSVTYTVYSNAACTAAVSTGTPETISTPGDPPPSVPVTLTIAGTYYWQATYSGDDNNAGSTTPCGSSGEVETVTPAQQPTTLTTQLSAGGQTGASISVPAGTAVTDAVHLSGADVSIATGSVTYWVYSNAECTAPVSTATAQITTPGTMPASPPVTLDSPGKYYWQASYSGDLNNAPFTTLCGSSGQIETVTPAPIGTTLTTSLLSTGQSGMSVTVHAGASVSDSAKLSGPNAAKATGTVTYRVYSNAACTTLAATAGTVTVTGGAVPSSAAETLSAPGTYYWTATYSGDSENKSATSGCGAQTEIVTPGPFVDAVSNAQASHTATVSVSTTVGGDLLVAFVAGRGPAGKSQTAAVSSVGLKWTFVGRENAGRGDAEVWYARASGTLHKLRVTATEKYAGSDVTLTVVAFGNAAGIGRHAMYRSGSGAPTGTLATSKNNSLVFAVGDDWQNSASRTAGAGQGLVYQSTDSAHDTYWVQATKAVTPRAGTTVTINDTKPAKDPYNLVLVEIVSH